MVSLVSCLMLLVTYPYSHPYDPTHPDLPQQIPARAG